MKHNTWEATRIKHHEEIKTIATAIHCVWWTSQTSRVHLCWWDATRKHEWSCALSHQGLLGCARETEQRCWLRTGALIGSSCGVQQTGNQIKAKQAKAHPYSMVLLQRHKHESESTFRGEAPSEAPQRAAVRCCLFVLLPKEQKCIRIMHLPLKNELNNTSHHACTIPCLVWDVIRCDENSRSERTIWWYWRRQWLWKDR